MAYEELRNFQDIFGRNDFVYVSELTNINEISEIILTKLANPDGNEGDYIDKINFFIDNLNSFCGWLKGMAVGDINEGYNISRQVLLRIIGLFKQSFNKRTAISRGYLRKFNKMFLYGLSRIVKGIRIAFKSDFVSATNIDRNQLEKFIMDKKEGLGNRYLFNTTGNHAFVKKLKSLTREELIITERLLLNPEKARRTRNGWIDFGEKRAPVRILVKPRTMLRDEVCCLFRLSEHRFYDRQLDTPSSEFQFSAA